MLAEKKGVKRTYGNKRIGSESNLSTVSELSTYYNTTLNIKLPKGSRVTLEITMSSPINKTVSLYLRNDDTKNASSVNYDLCQVFSSILTSGNFSVSLTDWKFSNGDQNTTNGDNSVVIAYNGTEYQNVALIKEGKEENVSIASDISIAKCSSNLSIRSYSSEESVRFYLVSSKGERYRQIITFAEFILPTTVTNTLQEFFENDELYAATDNLNRTDLYDSTLVVMLPGGMQGCYDATLKISANGISKEVEIEVYQGASCFTFNLCEIFGVTLTKDTEISVSLVEFNGIYSEPVYFRYNDETKTIHSSTIQAGGGSIHI